MSNSNQPDAPYVAFEDEEEDLEEGMSNSYPLHPTGHASSSRKSASRPSFIQALSASTQQQQRYKQLPGEEIEEQEVDEAPASLMVESPRDNSADNGTSRRPPWNFSSRRRNERPFVGPDIYELTLWKWVNVENFDLFFEQVYSYYLGKGKYCILLSRFLNILTLAFVIGFSTFLIGCVNYSNLRPNTKISEIIEPQCISRLSGLMKLFLMLSSCFLLQQIVRLIFDVRRLTDTYHFFVELLKIPDEDMQTVTWQRIVNQIIQIRDNNPTTSHQIRHVTQPQQRLDAHTIANRIMRQENYLIAMINKDILNLSVPIPFLGKQQMLTKIIEWNLSFCILDFVFNEEGQFSPRFVKDVNKKNVDIKAVKKDLSDELRRRFIFMAYINLIFAPFIVVYLLMYFFFRYFEEYYRNPSSINSRQWSPFAKWKFREFNELPHLFKLRLNNSHEPAMKYINQFPKEKSVLIARFVSLVAGSFAAILFLATLIDLEISPERPILFYAGIFGIIFEISRGMVPDDHSVFDAEKIMREVAEYTHYLPDDWRKKLHSNLVREEFSKLFEMKIVLFIQELLGVIFTPFSLQAIVDFFFKCTIHVDGVGYVCSFAVFDFKKHGNVKYGAPAEVDNEYYLSKEGKMEKSFLNFKANNPDWEPTDPAGSVYLSRLTEFNNQIHHDRSNNMRASGIDSILRTNRRTGNVHFGATTTATSSPYAHHRTNVADSILKENDVSHFTTPSQNSSLRKPYSAASAQENYKSELGESYFLERDTNTSNGVSDGPSSESTEPQVGIFGLLNQFYELNTTTI
ncbi:8030_t:CDS:10 [Ambispora gerdemannii]|uniref:Autophagy-related protein 9 n=1 Tax=Ambispora gerdemannii TaxID=144530 RepID=A0A9N8V345_9GLOM|nr:8030_t:CDS:10 [Ambispora gerdemannii]